MAEEADQQEQIIRSQVRSCIGMAEVGDPPAQRVDKLPEEGDAQSLDPEDQSLWRMTKRDSVSPNTHLGGNRSLRL